MTGIDAGFLYLETPSMHMHTLKVALLEPSAELDLDRFGDRLLSLLDALPPLARRAQRIPWALHHPVWVADRPVDPAHHVVRHRVPAPGGRAELEQLIGEIASTPLDRSLPLWEMHLCEGLADERTAVVGKMHHTLADGIAANALLANVVDGTPRVSVPQPLESTPRRRDLARVAIRDAVLKVADVPGLLLRTVRNVVALGRRERPVGVRVPRVLLDTPRTPFNGALTTRRSFATTSLPLAEIKQVRAAHDVTVNDVVLAVVGGALRSWLLERGELPTRSLTAGVPVATDAIGSEPRLGGNRVSNLFTVLATDVGDPRERLLTISRTTREAKRIQQALGADMLADWVEFTPPAALGAVLRLYSRLRLADRHRAPFNVVVSNVPGPREPATIGGIGLADLFSVGPLIEGIGLNVTVWSYVDRMNFTLLSCPDLVPDLDPLVARLRPALDELLALDRRTT